MSYEGDFHERVGEALAAAGVPVAWINDAEVPVTPRDEVGIDYASATPAVVEATRRTLIGLGVPETAMKVTVVIEFGKGEPWD